MSNRACAAELAGDLAAAQVRLRRAAQVLHDDVGSLLAVAGLRLQLLRMDHPAAETQAKEVSQALEGVMDHLRNLSRDLEPTPVRRTGLQSALRDLAAERRRSTGVDVAVRYNATANLPPALADAVFKAVDTAVTAGTDQGAARVRVTVSGARSLTAKVAYPAQEKRAGPRLAAAAMLAVHAGLRFEVALTKKGTIVSIHHAV